MQIEQLLFNPYLYKKGGNIEGDYKFQEGRKIEMTDKRILVNSPCSAGLPPKMASVLSESGIQSGKPNSTTNQGRSTRAARIPISMDAHSRISRVQ